MDNSFFENGTMGLFWRNQAQPPNLVSFPTVTLAFTGNVFLWRGPAPFYFIRVPDDLAKELKVVQGLVTYGWGMIPAEITIGETTWKTALWPKDGSFVVPLKDAVRKREPLEDGASATVTVRIEVIR